jgi:hypothetical protein
MGPFAGWAEAADARAEQAVAGHAAEGRGCRRAPTTGPQRMGRVVLQAAGIPI